MGRRDLIKQWMAWKSQRDGEPYTFKALAADAGLNQNYLSNVMTGYRNPGVKTLSKIADAFGISMSEFYNGPKESPLPVIESEQAVEPHKPYTPPEQPEQPEQPKQPEYLKPPELSGSIPENIAPTAAPPTPVSESVSVDKEADENIKTEKFGLRLSDNASAEFGKLFPTFEFESDNILAAEKSTDNSLSIGVSRDAGIRDAAGVPQGTEGVIPVLDSATFVGDIFLWLDAYEKDGSSFETVPRYIGGTGGARVFAIRVGDDSMKPDIGAGDLLIVDPDVPFLKTDGGIGVVCCPEFIKIRRIFSRGDGFHMVPSNPGFAPEIIQKNGITILKVSLWIPRVDEKF